MILNQSVEVAVKLLYNVLAEDINAVENIINAHAEILMGNKEGCKTIISALDGLVEFIQELADDLEEYVAENDFGNKTGKP